MTFHSSQTAVDAASDISSDELPSAPNPVAGPGDVTSEPSDRMGHLDDGRQHDDDRVAVGTVVRPESLSKSDKTVARVEAALRFLNSAFGRPVTLATISAATVGVGDAARPVAPKTILGNARARDLYLAARTSRGRPPARTKVIAGNESDAVQRRNTELHARNEQLEAIAARVVGGEIEAAVAAARAEAKKHREAAPPQSVFVRPGRSRRRKSGPRKA